MAPELKLIGKDDIPGCADIIMAAYREDNLKYGFSGADDPAPLLKRLEEMLSKEDARLFGALSSGKLAGFFMLDSKDEEVLEIANLCVLPECQGQGLGRFMLSAAFEEIQKLGGVAAVCAINDENSRLKGWLLGSGFFEEASGYVEGVKYPVCLLQKNFPQGKKSAAEGTCSSCSGGCAGNN